MGIALSHSKTVVMPAVVRKKKLKHCAKVDIDMVPARLSFGGRDNRMRMLKCVHKDTFVRGFVGKVSYS